MSSPRLAVASLLVLSCASCSAVPTASVQQPGAQTISFAAPPLNSRPFFNAEVTFGFGQDEHDIDGSLDDESDAAFFRFRAEGSSPSGFGGGFAVESMTSDDDLFGSTGDQRASYVEWDPYFLYRVVAGSRFRMPVRVGPWVQFFGFDDQNNDDRIIWGTVGFRSEIEPEVALARGHNYEFSLFADMSFAGGETKVDAEVGLLDDEFETEGSAFGFEFGPRMRWSHFMASLAYIYRSVSMDTSDSELFLGSPVVVRGFDNEFNGLVFSFGGGF